MVVAVRCVLCVLLFLSVPVGAFGAPGGVTYTAEQNRRIKAKLAELIGARKKIANRDKKIKGLIKRVNTYATKEQRRRAELVVLRKEKNAYRDQMIRSQETIKTTLVVAGVVVVVSVIAVGVTVGFALSK